MDEMAGGHHRLDGHEFEQAPGVGDGQGGLACCSPQSHKESDTTERLNRTEVISFRMNWLDLREVPGTLKSLLQYHSSKASILQRSAFFIV